MNLLSICVYAHASDLLSVLLLHTTSPAAGQEIYIVKQNYEKIAREICFNLHAIKELQVLHLCSLCILNHF